MKTKDNIIQVIENENSISKVLVINFPEDTNIKLLFTPKLENLSFVKFGNSVSINLINPSFKDFFDTWILAVEINFNALTEEDDLIERFNNEIKGIMHIGRKSSEISLIAARGMYGELLEFKKLILSYPNEEEVINAWHRPAPANHDFDFDNQTIEVKTISRTSTKVKISSEYQLEAFEEKPLYLKVYRIEHIEQNITDSLGLIYNEIIQLLSPGNAVSFQIKCAEDKFNKYLGPEFNKLNFRFNLIDCEEYLVDQNNFPRVIRQNLTPGISKVSYDVDISSMQLFLV